MKSEIHIVKNVRREKIVHLDIYFKDELKKEIFIYYIKLLLRVKHHRYL